MGHPQAELGMEERGKKVCSRKSGRPFQRKENIMGGGVVVREEDL